MHRSYYSRKCIINVKIRFESKKIKSIEWPQSVTAIPDSCFHRCINLKIITIPEGTKSIGTNAFYEYKSLQYIELPESLETIGSGAFTSCKITVNANKNKNIEIMMVCFSLI